MGCDALPVNGGFYCNACISRWDREKETRRRKEVEAKQSAELRKLRAEVAELKRNQKGSGDGPK